MQWKDLILAKAKNSALWEVQRSFMSGYCSAPSLGRTEPLLWVPVPPSDPMSWNAATCSSTPEAIGVLEGEADG